MSEPAPPAEPAPDLVTVAHVVYALHAMSLVAGAFGAGTVAGSFLFGWPSIVAVILNYLNRQGARGTWLESHFAWQIRTFWFALLWACTVALVSAVLLIVVIGVATWVAGLFALGAWAAYRVARGWLALLDRRALAAD